jgi:hypothetical protein
MNWKKVLVAWIGIGIGIGIGLSAAAGGFWWYQAGRSLGTPKQLFAMAG